MTDSTRLKFDLDTVKCSHTNLTAFEAVVSVLEGGCIYSGQGSDAVAHRIIAICHKEQQRLLRRMDAAEERLMKALRI